MNNIVRQPGEEFEYYIGRIIPMLYDYLFFTNDLTAKELTKINERLTKMATLAEQLGVEETTLAEIIPQLATEISTLQSALTTKETELKADLSTIGADAETIKKDVVELAAIQKVQEQLAPVIEKAKEIALKPTEAPVTETPSTPPVEPPALPSTPAETAPSETIPPANPEG